MLVREPAGYSPPSRLLASCTKCAMYLLISVAVIFSMEVSIFLALHQSLQTDMPQLVHRLVCFGILASITALSSSSVCSLANLLVVGDSLNETWGRG